MLVTLLVFFAMDSYDWWLFRLFAMDTEGWTRIGAVAALRYAPQFVAVCLVASLLFGPGKTLNAVGVTRSPLRGFLVGLFVTAVVAITLLLSSPLRSEGAIMQELLREAVLPGVFEEIWYRAFLFGFLFRFAGWGFLPSALLGALVFGTGHLYQSGDPAEAAAIFALTASGALWFSWLYVEWNYDVWIPAAIHLLMNAWWVVFDVSDNALGPMAANLARLAVIAVSIALTLFVTRKTGGRFVRGRAWFWGGPQPRS